MLSDVRMAQDGVLIRKASTLDTPELRGEWTYDHGNEVVAFCRASDTEVWVVGTIGWSVAKFLEAIKPPDGTKLINALENSHDNAEAVLLIPASSHGFRPNRTSVINVLKSSIVMYVRLQGRDMIGLAIGLDNESDRKVSIEEQHANSDMTQMLENWKKRNGNVYQHAVVSYDVSKGMYTIKRNALGLNNTPLKSVLEFISGLKKYEHNYQRWLPFS